MGSNNIQKKDVKSFDTEKIERILRLNLKELLIEQILELGKPKRHIVDKITRDTLNEIFG